MITVKRRNIELVIEDRFLSDYVKQGFEVFEAKPSEIHDNQQDDSQEDDTEKPLSSMKVAELKEIAKEKGIDNVDSLTKKELLALLGE